MNVSINAKLAKHAFALEVARLRAALKPGSSLDGLLIAAVAIGASLFAAIDLGAARGELPLLPPTVFIEGAAFTMGTPLSKGNRKYHEDEAPLRVTVKDFKIGKYPVTAAQMCAFLNSPEANRHVRETLYNHRDIGDYTYSTIELTESGAYEPRRDAALAPANQVTWKGAVLYCDWLSAKTGERFRLPSEAEWELAARGREGRPRPWGDESPDAKMGPRYDPDELLNSQQLHARGARNEPTWPTAPVGSHPANATPEGVHDMLAYIHGEWCANKYIERPSAEQVVEAAVDLDDLATDRVVRGYFHRKDSRPPLLPLAEWPHHGGRTWTRYHAHPLDAVRQAARYGFRLAQDAVD